MHAREERGPIVAISAPDVITRYFAAQSARDFDTLLTLFADDATVIDEGQTRRGANEIRAWRENVASVYQYSTELTSLECAGVPDVIQDPQVPRSRRRIVDLPGHRP